jgi:hypothetical protein
VGMAFHRIHFLANETPSSKSLNHFVKKQTKKEAANYAFLLVLNGFCPEE